MPMDKNMANEDRVSMAKEVQIPVPWGHISGKWWGPQDKQPVLALHGWQDNAGSFDTLAPLLALHVPVLCIDLPGHGRSSHYPRGQFYFMWWDGLLLLRRIVKHYKWENITILGHSLGGTIGFLYAASFPDDTSKLICIDISSPAVRSLSYFVKQTGVVVDKFLVYENMNEVEKPVYSYDKMMNLMLEAYKGALTKQSCEILLARGAVPAEKNENNGKGDGYHFSRDVRLKIGSLGFLSLDMSLEYASKIKCEVLNIRAIPGMEFNPAENYHKVLDKVKESAKKVEYHEVEGTHFVHLNNPERVAPVILHFLLS